MSGRGPSHLPPTPSEASRTKTSLMPPLRSCMAALRPATPAPTTTTSASLAPEEANTVEQVLALDAVLLCVVWCRFDRPGSGCDRPNWNDIALLRDTNIDALDGKWQPFQWFSTDLTVQLIINCPVPD